MYSVIFGMVMVHGVGVQFFPIDLWIHNSIFSSLSGPYLSISSSIIRSRNMSFSLNGTKFTHKYEKSALRRLIAGDRSIILALFEKTYGASRATYSVGDPSPD